MKGFKLMYFLASTIGLCCGHGYTPGPHMFSYVLWLLIAMCFLENGETVKGIDQFRYITEQKGLVFGRATHFSYIISASSDCNSD